MTNQTKPVLEITEENKAQLIAGIKSGTAIVINVVNVAGGNAEIEIGTFFTGTAEQREHDLQHRAISSFTAALSEMLGEGLDGGLSGSAVTRSIKQDPKLCRIFEPSLPEEMLTIFDNAESYGDAMKQLRDSALNVECNCPECTKEREQKAEEAVNDAAKEAEDTGSSIH